MSLYNKIIDQQKLQNAWKQVYKNKPKEGVDSVSCEEFEEDKKRKIRELWIELKNQTYKCMPVKLIPIYKGEKMRFISLYTMRDKVVQYSLAKELSSIFDPLFSDGCYAYRSGKSALQASEVIHQKIICMGNGYVFRADIHSFFDNILHDVLTQKLRKEIKEDDVIELILNILGAASLEKNGELIEKKLGIYQGATVAPVLSNVYLMEMDRQIEEETEFYIRYSDDILIFFRHLEEAEEYKEKMSNYLNKIGLKLNDNKTKIVSFEEGFEFLGYQFNRKGRKIPEKAENQLSEKLEEVWLNPRYKTLQSRLEKGSEILNGWEQYFTDDRMINGILE